MDGRKKYQDKKKTVMAYRKKKGDRGPVKFY